MCCMKCLFWSSSHQCDVFQLRHWNQNKSSNFLKVLLFGRLQPCFVLHEFTLESRWIRWSSGMLQVQWSMTPVVRQDTTICDQTWIWSKLFLSGSVNILLAVFHLLSEMSDMCVCVFTAEKQAVLVTFTLWSDLFCSRSEGLHLLEPVRSSQQVPSCCDQTETQPQVCDWMKRGCKQSRCDPFVRAVTLSQSFINHCPNHGASASTSLPDAASSITYPNGERSSQQRVRPPCESEQSGKVRERTSI